MVNYRRNKTGNPDDIFFLVFNTFKRTPWIADLGCFDLLTGLMNRAECEFGVRFHAWVILPDHIHWLIQPGKADYSTVVSSFKKWATWRLKYQNIIRHTDKRWQDRFWEETIRDDDHYSNCVEYIHFNPVKHGLVESPWEWEFSSFRRFVKDGLYLQDWASDMDLDKVTDKKLVMDVRGTKYD